MGGVGVVDGEGGAAFGDEGAGLVDEFFGEIEGGEVVVTQFPEAEGYASGTAAGFEEAGVFVGKETLDEEFFGFPESEAVCGAGVVNDGDGVVEVVADGRGGDFAYRRQRRKREVGRTAGLAVMTSG